MAYCSQYKRIGHKRRRACPEREPGAAVHRRAARLGAWRGAACGRPGGALFEEASQLAAEARDVDQEGVVALERGHADEARRHAVLLERLRDRGLLLDREQHVALDTDYQHRLAADPAQRRGEAAAVLGEIESVHGAGEVQVAVRVEDAHEALGLALEIGLDGVTWCELAELAGIAADRLAAEALPQLGGRAVGD